MSQLKKGALLTYLNIFLTNVVGILLTPFIIRSLGDSEYGLYTLIGSFVVYLAVMDLGLSNTIVRFVAKYRLQKDIEGEQQFLGTTMMVYAVISTLIFIIGMIMYFNLDNVFSKSLSFQELVKAKIMFLILVFNLVITIPGGAFQAICNAYEHFVFPRALTIIKYVSRSIMVLVIVWKGGKAISLVVIDTVFTILFIAASAFYVFKKLNIKFKFGKYDSVLIKEIFSYSFWVFLFGIVSKFQWNAGQVVLGINSNTVVVAVFGVGVMLGGYYGAFASAINSVLIPKATQMVLQKSSGTELTNEMIKIGRLNFFLLALILSGFFLFGKQFIFLWVGPTYADSWIVAFLIMIVLTIPFLQVFGNSILEAKRKNRFKSMFSFVSVGLAVIVGFYTSKYFGTLGMILPLVSAMGINAIVMNFYYKKIFDFNISLFFTQAILKPLIVYSILCSLFFYFIKDFLNNFNWMKLFIGVGLYSIIYSIVTYTFVLNNYEKNMIYKNKTNS